eukprot:GSChrysophyteH1.ASY1.ANO1.1217.1 assembled CDS
MCNVCCVSPYCIILDPSRCNFCLTRLNEEEVGVALVAP